MRDKIQRLTAAQHLRELLCSDLVGALLHQLGDHGAIELAQKLAAKVGEAARSLREDSNG
jgi:hypothetical protein